MKLRNLITAAALGTAAYAATPVPAATAAQSTPAAVTAFWQYLYALQHAPNTCGVVHTSEDSTVPDTILYGGNCLQAFWIVLTDYRHDPEVAFVWDVSGPVAPF